MDRNVKISIQKWEPIGDGRVKMKIAEKGFNITSVTHKGEPYVTVKKYGRGRYIMRLAPGYKRPVPVAPPVKSPKSDREPLQYQETP